VEPISLDERLSQIETCWNVLKQAHGGSSQKREHAQAWFVERYERIVRHYLTRAVGPEAGAELVQEFATRMLEGRYHNVNDAVGRFRVYLKTCLFGLVADYRKRQAKGKMQRLPEHWEPVDPLESDAAAEEEWRKSWRQALIERTLDALRQLNQGKDKFLYPVLQFCMAQPELSSQEAAALLSERISKQVSAGWLHKKLMHARERFAGLMLEEVARLVHLPTLERVIDELIDLNLLRYCDPLLKKD
jgi:DNA-directed RNA polymerase specialized sigma24 family protein